MKVEKEAKEFEPVTIKITFETERELQDFYSIFNYTPIINAVNIDDKTIRDLLYNETGYDEDVFIEFTKRLEGKKIQ